MTYQHKVGATFSLTGAITAPAGVTVPDFTGTVVSSQIRKLDGTLIADLDASWVDVATRTVKLYKQDTSGWAVGMAELDVRFTNPAGEVVLTSTQALSLVRGVTNA